MIIDQVFLEQVAPLRAKTMGTELMAPMLYSLARTTRPRAVLEVGMGYTTLFLLQALADNRHDFLTELESFKSSESDESNLLLESYYADSYEPKLYAIDNLQHEKTTANSVPNVASRLGLAEFLEVQLMDLSDFPPARDTTVPDFDFIWFDCGGIDNYMDHIPRYFDLLNGDGGLLVIHSTLTNFHAQLFITDLKLRQATNSFQDFELVSFLEPHKYRQNSFTVLRKTTHIKRRLYTHRG